MKSNNFLSLIFFLLLLAHNAICFYFDIPIKLILKTDAIMLILLLSIIGAMSYSLKKTPHRAGFVFLILIALKLFIVKLYLNQLQENINLDNSSIFLLLSCNFIFFLFSVAWAARRLNDL